MDLLNENQYKKEQTPKSKKIVLIILILAIIATIFIVFALLYIRTQQKLPETLKINDKEVKMTETLIIETTEGNKYISLKEIAQLLGYEYYNNEYGESGENKEKGYIKSGTLITGFEKDTKKIYKYEEETNLDYQYYELKSNVIMYNNNLYISSADISQALNVIYGENKSIISIQTINNKIDEYTQSLKLKDNGYTIAQDLNNQKAIIYGMLVVKKNDKWGVIDKNSNEIIGNKYSTIYFDEYNMNFIVSDSNGRYGILSNNGEIICALKYDGLEILNYENMLYKVKYNGKYGIMSADTKLLTNIIYDDIGYPEDSNKKIKYTLIIPELIENVGEMMVVKQNNKYGLIDISTGEEVIGCDQLDKIYAIEELGEISYKVEINETTFDLIDVIKYLKTN